MVIGAGSLVPLVPWSVDPVLETIIVELGLVQVKAFDLKYTIATSVNLTRYLDLMAQKLEKFSKICGRQTMEEIRDLCNELKVANELTGS